MIVTLVATLVAVVVLQVGVWVLSVRRQDASIVDIFWGLSFALIAWVGFAVGDGASARSWLLAVLVTVWGVRLAAYLARRNLPHGEDPRYGAMRRRRPDTFARWSLYAVFLAQAGLAWVVALPVTLAMADPTPAGLTPLAGVGLGLWLVGLFFEAVGDAQLARFKADPANQGQVMDRGLWRYTRHPNYFGDFCVWWGLFVISAASGTALLGVVGPILMTVLLTRVSGKDLLERTIGKRRPGYAEYVRRTNAFFPGPPRKG